MGGLILSEFNIDNVFKVGFYRFDFFKPTQLLVWTPAASRIMHPVPRAWQRVAIGGFLWTVWCSVMYMAEMRPLGTGDRLILRKRGQADCGP